MFHPSLHDEKMSTSLRIKHKKCEEDILSDFSPTHCEKGPNAGQAKAATSPFERLFHFFQAWLHSEETDSQGFAISHETHLLRYLFIILWLILGLLVSSAVFISVHSSHSRERKEIILRDCEYWTSMLNQKFSENTFQARIFSNLVSTFYLNNLNATIDQDSFSKLASDTRFVSPLCKGIGLSKRVFENDRKSFESSHGAGFCIRNAHGTCCKRQDEYAPLILFQYDDENEDGFTSSVNDNLFNIGPGVDLYQYSELLEPLKRTKSGVWGTLTRPLATGSSPRPYDLIRFFPVFYNPEKLAPTCTGFFIVLVRFRAICDSIFEDSKETRDKFFRVYDSTESNKPVVLYQRAFDAESTKREISQVALNLDLGDPMRKHEMHCGYLNHLVFPFSAFWWSSLTFIVFCAMAFVAKTSINSMEDLKLNLERMRSLKEAAEVASKAKGSFLATMSHEIRTPMNGILGMLNLLLQTPLNSTQLDYVETARTSGKALCSLINDILDLSKIEANRMQLERIPMDIRAEIDNVLTTCIEQVRDKKGVEIAAYVHPYVPSILLGDPLRFRQVLINLLSNSIKFTHRGHIFICARLISKNEDVKMFGRPSQESLINHSTSLDMMIPIPLDPAQWDRKMGSNTEETKYFLSSIMNDVEEETDGGDDTNDEFDCSTPESFTHQWLTLSGREAVESGNSWINMQNVGCSSKSNGEDYRLIVSVEDTGEGIPYASQSSIFRPFVQADASTTRTHGGTGIGLSISRRLVKLMGGKIGFVSQPGIGTTFYFDAYFPSRVSSSPYSSAPLPASLPSPISSRIFRKGFSQSDFKKICAFVLDDLPVRKSVTENYLSSIRVGIWSTSEFPLRSQTRKLTGRSGLAAENLSDCYPSILVDSDWVKKEGGFGSEWKDVATRIFFETCDKRGWERPKLRSLRFVFLTWERAHEKPALDAGFSSVLLKPLRMTSLAASLVQAFSKPNPKKNTTLRSHHSLPPLGARRHHNPLDFPDEAEIDRERYSNEYDTYNEFNEVSCSGRDFYCSENTDSIQAEDGSTKESDLMGSGDKESFDQRNGVQPKESLSNWMEMQREWTESRMHGEEKDGRDTAAEDSESGSVPKRRILVVDDNAVNRKVISKTLLQCDFDVDTIDSGENAIKLLIPIHNYSCILMDVQMPGMDGFQTTKLIRELEGKGMIKNINKNKSLVIFALTADITSDTREMSADCGMDGFLSKPIEIDEILPALESKFDFE